jgi:isoleucyl-tRNA synthetase
VLGKKVGGMMKQLAAAIAQMSQEDIAAFEAAGTFTLCDYALVAEDVDIITEDMPGWLVANNGVITVALDITLTDELIYAGFAREFINRVQNHRKNINYNIVTRINISIIPDKQRCIYNAIRKHRNEIKEQVLASSITISRKKVFPKTKHTPVFTIYEREIQCEIVKNKAKSASRLKTIKQ